MLFNRVPGFFHFFAPVDIIKNHYCVIVAVLKQPIEVGEGRFFSVIAIYECKING